MKYFLSPLVSLLFFITIQSQQISANVAIDKFGNLFVTELIDDLNINSDTLIIYKRILIHNKYADLIGDFDDFITYKPKVKELSYVVNLPKGKSNNYIKKEDFFFSGLNYLALKKENIPKRNTFDIHVKLPTDYKLVYPDKKDLKEAFYFAPPIIAGQFKEEKVQDYNVYTLKSEKYYPRQLNEIIGFMDKVFHFYSKTFGAVKQPKIILLPFKGSLAARTIDNAVILNSNRFKYGLNKKVLAHELAHLWWGFGGLFFKNHEITEGMADFMALQFLKQKDEFECLKKNLDTKNYNSEGIASLEEVENHQKDKRAFSYNFVPLLFQTYQNNNPVFYELLADFYKENKSKIRINLKDLNQFLVKNSLPELNTNDDLPDFFILENHNFLVIKGATKKLKEVVVEYIKEDNTISYDTLIFSPTSKTFRIQKENVIKASIDPNNKIHQFSKLNDVWLKDQQSLFSKNRYFNKGKINPKAIKMSELILDYLLDKNTVLDNNICNSQFKLKSELDKIKELLKNEGLNTIIPTGAVATYNYKKHLIYLKFTYYSRVENKSKLLVLQLFTDKDVKYLDKVVLKYPKKE